MNGCGMRERSTRGDFRGNTISAAAWWEFPAQEHHGLRGLDEETAARAMTVPRHGRHWAENFPSAV